MADDPHSEPDYEALYKTLQGRVELQNEMIDLLMAYLSLTDQMFTVFLQNLSNARKDVFEKWGRQRLAKFQAESGELN